MGRHFSREALLRLLRGPASEAETTRAIRHVMECRHCRRVGAECLLQEKVGDVRNPLVAILQADANGWIEDMEAGIWWNEIKDLGPESQITKIRSTAALQSLQVFEEILADTRTTALSDPFLGESKARVALVVADLLPEPHNPRALKNDLRGKAMMAAANCRRLAADFPGAASAIEESRRYLAQGTGDPGLKAGLLSIHCSLCTDLGDFEKALACVRRAVKIFRELEDWQALAHNAVLEANCLLAANQTAEAIERAHFALERMPLHETRLEVLAKLILAEGLIILERPLEARPHLADANSLCKKSQLGLQLLALSVEARLLDALGSVRESEKLFRQTVKAFFDQEMYKQAFLTLLTLFECLVRRGALDKAAALCEEAIAATSQTGEACNEQIRRAWEELLATVRVRQLSESELSQARQYLVRNWSVAAGTFPAPAGGGRPAMASLPSRAPAASTLAGHGGLGARQLSGGPRRVRPAARYGGPGKGRRQPQRGQPPARDLPQHAQGTAASVRAVSAMACFPLLPM
jgi:tetratricopeptide (TPR) repeat protein